MIDAEGQVIYVGKAKNLRKRLQSYFRVQVDPKTAQLVRLINDIQVTITDNERAALLLESNLIKSLKPRYNVIFRDDKSYPYLFLSKHAYPQLDLHRGTKKRQGQYFGPYPSVRAVRDSLDLIQRLFLIRQCRDSFFNNRQRPCLQYQIKRCSAPCVGYISEKDYQEQINLALAFVNGRSDEIIEQLHLNMDLAAKELDYEKAAVIRDQIASLRTLQDKPSMIESNTRLCADVLGVAFSETMLCVHKLEIRHGRLLGSRQYFPKVTDAMLLSVETILEQFISQHYVLQPENLSQIKELILPRQLESEEGFGQCFQDKLQVTVGILVPQKGMKKEWVKMASKSAQKALDYKMATHSNSIDRMQALSEWLEMTADNPRIVCFDVSHTFGEQTVASCVVFDKDGAVKSEYKRFNIKQAKKSDDYGALKEALTRYFEKIKTKGYDLPDVLLIDGGKGQLGVAEQVIESLQLSGMVLLGIAKGPQRKSGEETLFTSSKGETLDLTSPQGFLLLQQVRDEAHRFAITAHRQQRQKGLKSSLEDIDGVGPTRRMALLRHFGGYQEVVQASVEQLAQVKGISQALAKKIFKALHGA